MDFWRRYLMEQCRCWAFHDWCYCCTSIAVDLWRSYLMDFVPRYSPPPPRLPASSKPIDTAPSPSHCSTPCFIDLSLQGGLDVGLLSIQLICYHGIFQEEMTCPKLPGVWTVLLLNVFVSCMSLSFVANYWSAWTYQPDHVI